MWRNRWLLGILLSSGLLTGCVERRFVVLSDPPGAVVLRNGKPIGAAPADDHFTYYGKYQFTLIKDGYQTQTVEQDIPAPWYQYYPLDFIFENLWPFRIEDVRYFHYRMDPLQAVRVDELLNQAQQARSRGQGLGQPSQFAPPSTAPVVLPGEVGAAMPR